MKDPKVSVIIPTLNERSTIGKLIESLHSDPCPKEVIVVDGGSSDGTRGIARSKGARVIRETGKKCLANARNIGAKNAIADVLCFMDGDVERVGEYFLSKAIRHFESDNVAGVRCEREIVEDTLVEKVIRSLRSLGSIKFLRKKEKKKESKEFEPVNFLRKKTFEDIGGLPSLGFGEDRILWSKLKAYVNGSEKRIAYEPESKLFQHRPHTFKEMFDQSEWYGRTVLSYLRRRSPGLMEILSIFAPLAYVISATMIPLALLHHLFLVLGIPFLIRIILAVIGSLELKSKYALLIPILDLIRGSGFVKGLLLRIFAGEKLARD